MKEPVTPEALILWRAKLMVDICGADAVQEAQRWADRLLAEGNAERAAQWQPIIRAIEELQRTTTRKGVD